MFETCLAKQAAMKARFAHCVDREALYQAVIDLGRGHGGLAEEYRVESNRVIGCQSRMYLRSFMEAGVMRFVAESDALISNGLAALLVGVYDGELPEVVLKCAPTYLEELGIPQSLTPGRANGLASLLLKMKQETIRCVMAAAKA